MTEHTPSLFDDIPTDAVVDPGNITEAPAVAAAATAAPWTNLNPIFNAIADAMGVEVGSWPWMQAGPAPYSGQSGSQASYGWKHDHKVDDSYLRAVLANYGHRRSYYSGAPFRSFPYESAGRPKNWAPESPDDLPSGQVAYLTSRGEAVLVSGPDAEHFWLNPLWAVMDSPPVQVKALGRTWPSTFLARLMATHLTQSVVGMIRDSSGGTSQAPYPWAYGDRANTRILDTIIQAFRRGCLLQGDVATAYYWIRDVLLPWYEQTPGISFFNLQPIPANHWSIGCFNGLYWLLPTFYEAAKVLPGPIGDRLMACVTRWSQWALDLEETVPGKGFNMAQVFLPRGEFKQGGPLPSIKALITDPQTQIRFDGITWETWSFRAASVAAKVTGSPVLTKAVDGILNRRAKDPSNKVWLVDADGEYAG